jgi:hypothetical protein
MTWYQKPKPSGPLVPPGPCVICSATGSLRLGGPIAPSAHAAIPKPLWICRSCADERRGDSESN